MLLAEDGRGSLLYTGDFKLDEPVTAERAEIPRADILVIECTYGHPDYRLPPRAEVIGQLVEEIRKVLEADATPVIEAYTLGKAQEVTRILTLEGIPVLQHRKVFEITRIYQSFGVEFGQCGMYRGEPESGHVLVVPPRWKRLEGVRREVRFAVTGWAKDEAARYRLGVDTAIPLSDHADYDDLIEAVARVCPREVYCTHGPESFVDRLRDAGFDARPLGRPSQMRLF
jgi:Cft2 family RNA processing exonuclease